MKMIKQVKKMKEMQKKSLKYIYIGIFQQGKKGEEISFQP